MRTGEGKTAGYSQPASSTSTHAQSRGWSRSMEVARSGVREVFLTAGSVTDSILGVEGDLVGDRSTR
jgi:hypothetical protein